MLKGYIARESLGTPNLAKLTFFIQRRCEPVHLTICSAKTLIFHRCTVFVGDRAASTYEKYKWHCKQATLLLTGEMISFLTVLKHNMFFIRLNCFDCKKGIMQLFSV